MGGIFSWILSQTSRALIGRAASIKIMRQTLVKPGFRLFVFLFHNQSQQIVA